MAFLHRGRASTRERCFPRGKQSTYEAPVAFACSCFKRIRKERFSGVITIWFSRASHSIAKAEVGSFPFTAFFRSKLGFVELVDLCSQDEISLRQAVDLVRPGRDLDFPPGKEDVWWVPLLLRKLAYAVYEFEGFAKVVKLETPRDVVFFDALPAVHLLLQRGEFRPLERRHSSSAWAACFSCSAWHHSHYSSTG